MEFLYLLYRYSKVTCTEIHPRIYDAMSKEDI